MSRDILNRHSIKVYTNTLEDGEAVEIEQINSTTQTRANVSFKTRTTEQTASSEDDLMLVADNATGKVLKYSTIRNVHNSLIWKDVDKAVGTGRNVSLVNTANNVVIGVDSNNNENNRKLLLIGESNQVALEVFKGSIFRDGDLLINSDAKLVIRSNTYDYIFSQNANLTANRTINLPLLTADGTMMIDETGVGLKLVTNLFKSSDGNVLVDATSSGLVQVGNTSEELRLISNSTGIKLMNDQLLDSTGNILLNLVGSNYTIGSGTGGYMTLNSGAVRLGNDQLSDSGGNTLLNLVSSNYTIGTGTGGHMTLNSGAVRLANNQLSDSAGGSFINKAGTLITVGNDATTLGLDSLATGIKINKGILFTGANDNLISTVGLVTSVGYPTNSYTQLSGAHVRLGSDKLYDSAGVNLLSKAGSTITVGSAGVATNIAGTFQIGSNIEFADITAGSSNKLFYTFSGSATTYDLLDITRDGSTDADSIMRLGNTSHRLKLSSNNSGILVDSASGFKISATGQNMLRYTESLGSYDIQVGNIFNDLILSGQDVVIASVSLGTPTQFLIANSTGVQLGSSNKQLSLRGDATFGIKIESTLRNTVDRVFLDYDTINGANIFGSTVTDKSILNGTEIDVYSIGDIDFNTGGNHPFDTYAVKIQSTGSIQFNNSSGLAQSIKTRSNNNLIGINSANTIIEVGNTAQATHINSVGEIKFFDGTTENFKIGGEGDLIFVDATTKGLLYTDGGSQREMIKVDSGTINVGNSSDDVKIQGDLEIDRDIFTDTSKKRVTFGQDNKYETSFYCDVNGDQQWKIQQDLNIVLYNGAGNAARVVNYTIPSERYTKKDIVAMDSVKSLEAISQLIPCSFKYREEEQIDDETHTGFIVDEIEPVLPECIVKITGGAKERKLLTLDKIVPTLVSAVQQLTEKVTQLENIIEKNNLSV